MVVCLAGCASSGSGRHGVRPAALTDVGGYIEAVARARENDIESKVGGSDRGTKETRFEENLRLETEGYVYHPNLLEFSVGGLFGLLQREFEDNFGGVERTSGDDGTVVEFDLTGDFFKKKKYPGTIYAHRYQALEPRPFQSSLENTAENFGLNWQYVSEKAPTSVQFNQTEVLLDPLDDDEEESRHENTNFRFQTGYRFSPHNILSFIYEHKTVEEQPFDFNYDSDEITLAHNLNFGEGHRHILESEVNVFDQRGTFNIERSRWREVLRLNHTESLRSIYQLELTQRTQGSLAGVEPIEEESYFASAMVEHELYDSLITQILGFAQTQDFEGGPQIGRLGAQASFDYHKKNPWGVLRAQYRARFQNEERQGGDRTIEIVDDRRTFNDPDPLIITGTQIQSASLRITDIDRTQLYQLGRDYRVDSFDDRVEIGRVPTGRIADRQVVLLSYLFILGGAFDIDTWSQNLGIRQDFKFGLTPYYRLRHQEQTVSPPTAIGAIEDDISAQVFGLEYRRYPVRLIAEYEDHESSISPFRAVRLSAGLDHRFKSGATGRVRGRWVDISRPPPDRRDTTFFTVEGLYRHPITRSLTVEGEVIYRNEEDTLSGDDEGLDLDLSLEWLIRQTELRITYEYGTFQDDFARSEHSALYVQLRRNF